ncbi:tryptophan 2,3-dioxygenase [Hamadaea tsunoensis]|uniref:tryptophan 2,3-dioxygenase n=1 Tax=Hamadaea tsunoensis TaxID=53368 RepID=UPI000556E64C|nr:tryptophan 2,3-dioxygenase family protein [Hamadaea tsunoensis]
MVYGTGAPKTTFDGSTPYAEYGHIETLLSLQTPRTQAPAEFSFIVGTQVMELLFALIRHEWEDARTRLDADDLRGALQALRRSTGAQDVLIKSWDLLGTLTPAEFASFRDSFGEASGFQSYGYRHLEFLLGNKRSGLVCPHAAMPAVVADLDKQLEQPSLDETARAFIRRRGHEDWLSVYRGQDDGLVELGETLLAVAERFLRWKQLHLTAVWRVMGDKPGSGGSSGARWLEKTVHERAFSELWEVRNQL